MHWLGGLLKIYMSSVGEDEQDALTRLIEVSHFSVNGRPYIDFYGLAH